MFLKLINMNDGDDWQRLSFLAVTVMHCIHWRKETRLDSRRGVRLTWWLPSTWCSDGTRDGNRYSMTISQKLHYLRCLGALAHKVKIRWSVWWTGMCTTPLKGWWNQCLFEIKWDFLKTPLDPALVRAEVNFEIVLTFRWIPECYFQNVFSFCTFDTRSCLKQTDSPLRWNINKSICRWIYKQHAHSLISKAQCHLKPINLKHSLKPSLIILYDYSLSERTNMIIMSHSKILVVRLYEN